MRILALHARNTTKVATVTLSSAYLMAGPHPAPVPMIHSEMRPSHVSATFPKGVVRDAICIGNGQ